MDSFKNFGDKLIGEFEQIGRMLSEKMARGIQNGSGAAQKALETMNDDLLESQQKYLAEKDKLEQKMEEAEEAKYQREFQQRLKKAKNTETKLPAIQTVLPLSYFLFWSVFLCQTPTLFI